MKTETAWPAEVGSSWGAITHCTPFQNLSNIDPLCPVIHTDDSVIKVRETLFLTSKPGSCSYRWFLCLFLLSIDPTLVQLSLMQDTRSKGKLTSTHLLLPSSNSQNLSLFCSNFRSCSLLTGGHHEHPQLTKFINNWSMIHTTENTTFNDNPTMTSFFFNKIGRLWTRYKEQRNGLFKYFASPDT